MDYQYWLVDLELLIAFWLDPMLFENKKYRWGCVVSLVPDGKCELNIRDGR